MNLWLYCTFLFAQEGFWKPDALPSKPEWSKIRPRLTNQASTLLSSVVRLPNCTGAKISKSGLVITNAHCIHSYVQAYDTTFHAQEEYEETPLQNFYVYSTTSVSDVHQKVYKGISKNALQDYIEYRTERNKRVLLKSCHAGSMRYQCHIHFDTTTQRYQLVQEERYDDIRLVHLSSTSHSDIALIRIYKNGKPIPTPQHLKANIEEPKSHSDIAILGYPIHSHRHPLPIEWELLKEFMNTTLSYTARVKKTINASDTSKIVPLRKIIIEMEQNASIFLKQYQETSPYEILRSNHTAFINWTKQDPNRKKWRHATQEYIRILKKQHEIQLQLLELKYFSLSSDLLFSARRRYGWRESRKIPNTDRIAGYRDQDKEAFLLHIQNLSTKWNQKTETILLKQMLHASYLPAVQDFLKTYPTLEDAIFDLYTHTQPLLSTKDSLLHLNIRHPLPSNPWFSLGNKLEQLYFDLQESKIVHDTLQKKLHKAYMEGIQEWSVDSVYPDANGSLRISFGTLLSNANIFPRTSYFAKEAALLYSYHRWLPFFTSDVDATHGNSGSVTINKEGEWIGILFGGNVARHTSPYLYARNTENHHISTSNILWYFSSHPHWSNITNELTHEN
ncbi:MAG: hypothetical protein CL916_13315 [Deltaproteobacteria bacterium]|nr:hypothetical protein [Deltaproteobacteria bacterium]